MEIRKAEAREYPMTIGLAGPGGSGKTFTALMMATAFAQSEGGKVGMIDTEEGRGERYHKHFPEYLYGQLDAPFSPQRYMDAMQQMVDAGAKAIVVDSASHEWEGEGGILEMHDKETGGNYNKNFVSWAKVKPHHRRFIEFSKRTGIHTIHCFRAREKSKPNPDKNAPKDEKIINIGWKPVTNDDASFEFTLFGMMEPGGEGTLMEVKSFIDFRSMWKPGMKITIDSCERLVEAHRVSCLGSGGAKATANQKSEAQARDDAGQGIAPLDGNSTAKPNGIQAKLMELADADTMEAVIAIEDQMDKHRASLKPKQIEVLNRAIREAKARLNGDDQLSAADRHMEMITAGETDLDEIAARIDADGTLSDGDVQALFTALDNKRSLALP
jgi:hypothetical protein